MNTLKSPVFRITVCALSLMSVWFWPPRVLAQPGDVILAPAAAPPPQLVAMEDHAPRTVSILIDGEILGVGIDGQQIKQKMDALAQASRLVPSARFVRVYAGDTLARVAAQFGLDPKSLAELNRTSVARVYGSNDVVCLDWGHVVQEGETWAELAQRYNTTLFVLARLNGAGQDKPLQPGQRLRVPGEFSYHFDPKGQSHLQVTQYGNGGNEALFQPGTERVRQATLEAGQDLAAFARQHGVEAEFLRQMNDLPANAVVSEGDALLIEFSVELRAGASGQDVVAFLGVDPRRLMAVNGVNDLNEIGPGQRAQIPIGEQLGQTSQPRRVQDVLEVYEIVLGSP